MFFREAPKNEADLMRKIVRDALWDIRYHEDGLRISRKVAAYAKVLIARGEYPFTLAEASEEYEEQEENPDDLIEWVKSIVGSAVHGVDYHEEELTKAHTVLGVVKTMLLRGDYSDINVDEIAKEVAAKFDEPKGIEA